MKTIAFLNQKGGVGKTTLTRNIGECLASMGYRILLVDLDHQANLTLSMNVQYVLDQENISPEETAKYQIVDFCIGDMFDDNYFKAIEVGSNLFLLPNEIGFATKEVSLQARFRRENILTNILEQIREPFDYCLIDCPPSFGLVTANALIASDFLVVPVQPSEYAFRGLKTMLKNISYVRNVNKEFFRVVLNDYENNTKEASFSKNRLSELQDVSIFETSINHAQVFIQAERQHLSIFKMDNARAKDQIKSLTDEIITI